MTRNYLVVFEKSKDAWGAFAPDVPGTGGLGDTVDEARQSLREGIGYMLEDYLERGLPFPETTSRVDFSDFDPTPENSHYEIEWLTVDLPAAVAAPDQSATEAA